MPRLSDFSAAFRGSSAITKAYFNGSSNDIGAVHRYFTRIDTGSKGFELGAVIPIPSGPMAYRVRMAFIGNVSLRISPVLGDSRIELDSVSGSLEFYYRFGGVEYPLATLEGDYSDGSIVEYVLAYDGANVEGFINGASVGVTARTVGGFNVNDVFPDGAGNSVYYPQSVEIWFDTNDTSTDPDWACQFDSDGTGSTETDTVGGNNLTRIGLTPADTELFTFDSASNSWKNSDESVVLPVTY